MSAAKNQATTDAPCASHGYAAWIVGDVVSRIGTDEQEIVEINRSCDLMLFRCIKSPHDGFCEIGDEEWNVPWRYEFVRRKAA